MQVSIPLHIQQKMKRLMFFARKREIGGILLGEEIGVEKFRIVDFSVDTKSGTPARFNRVSDHHDRVLEDFFRRTGREYRRYNYLGEWHTHPTFDVKASSQDIAAMHDLVENSEGISFSMLLIARLKWLYQLQLEGSLFAEGGAHTQIELITKNH